MRTGDQTGEDGARTVNVAYNADCLAAMREMPDNAFDLAVVDPPYGGGSSKDGVGLRFHAGDRWDKYKSKIQHGAGHWKYPDVAWDIAPSEEYFEQLFRVSKNQIIWGGNYFDLPPTRCFLVWRKTNIPVAGFSMSSVEYAWTSFDRNAMVFEFSSGGQVGRFHPTQKPVELYKWIFQNYAKPGDKILDTHLGSGSSRIAAYDAGLDFVGYEIDETYFRLQEERFNRHAAQMNLFLEGDNT